MKIKVICENTSWFPSKTLQKMPWSVLFQGVMELSL